jgi:acyl-coenzyme A synthetase/AMP-(fatty) acid ligase
LTDQGNNVGFAFLAGAARRVDQPAILGSRDSITYGALSGVTINMARHMQACGAGPGKTVALATNDLVVLLSGILATALIGARWVFASTPRTLSQAGQVDLILDTQPDPEKRFPGANLMDTSWALPPEGAPPDEPFPGYADADAVWVMSPTSGTTGVPKLVGISQATYARRIALNAELFPREGVRICGLFRINAGGQISRYLSALLHGGTILHDPDPRVWHELGADLVFGSPVQVREAIGETVLPSRLPRVHLSGSTAPEKLVRHLLRSFETVTNGYGSTEGFNVLSVRHRLGPDGDPERETTLRPGVTLVLVDENDHRVGEGQEGIVRIRNDVLAEGYVGMPDLTREIFRDGWFYPGDLARWTAEGNFEVTGRMNDQFNIGGVKINAALMDYRIQNVEGVKDAACFMAPTEDEGPRLTAFVQYEPGYAEHEVRERIWYALVPLGGPVVVPKRFLKSTSIPRTLTGKVDRDACVAAWKAARRLRDDENRDRDATTK